MKKVHIDFARSTRGTLVVWIATAALAVAMVTATVVAQRPVHASLRSLDAEIARLSAQRLSAQAAEALKRESAPKEAALPPDWSPAFASVERVEGNGKLVALTFDDSTRTAQAEYEVQSLQQCVGITEALKGDGASIHWEFQGANRTGTLPSAGAPESMRAVWKAALGAPTTVGSAAPTAR